MNQFFWGIYPYICGILFLVVPIVRMIYRPFGWSTRASSIFNKGSLGIASLLLHWGIIFLLIGHLAGLFGGIGGYSILITFFLWIGLIGGFMALIGSIIALFRRFSIPEVNAMSQVDDYAIHFFLIPIIGIALYQVIAFKIFGLAYPVSSWLASVWLFAPQIELMSSSTFITQVHVFLALTFLAYFPFTKLVHVWTYPINYFVRPYQSMRTNFNRFHGKWEFGLISDKSFLVYSIIFIIAVFGIVAYKLGTAKIFLTSKVQIKNSEHVILVEDKLSDYALYVSQCARCHGLSGKGDIPEMVAASPSFTSPPRDLTAAQYRFISTTNGIASDEDLAKVIRFGLTSAGMPAFYDLSDLQVASLVSVVRSLALEEIAEPGSKIKVQPVGKNVSIDRGRELFKSCSPCHGEKGLGDGPAGASLATLPTDLTKDLKAGSSPEQIYTRIAAGIPPVMPSFKWESDEIWSVVNYICQELRK